MKLPGSVVVSLIAFSLSMFSLWRSTDSIARASERARAAELAAHLPRRLHYAYAFYGGVAWAMQMHMADRMPGRVSTMAACDSAFTADSSYIARALR